jgi:hypothetical protein
MRVEAERACDDAVIQSDASDIEYAGLLLEIARESRVSFSIQEFDSALKHIQQWMDEADNPGPIPSIFMTQTYCQLHDYPAAIERLEAGLEEAKHHNLEIKENWWALLVYLSYEETRWIDVISVLEILNQEFPDAKYKGRLEGVRGLLADQQNEAS